MYQTAYGPEAFVCIFIELITELISLSLLFQVNRPISMKKDGIQTRKRKPKGSSSGGKSGKSSSSNNNSSSNSSHLPTIPSNPQDSKFVPSYPTW